MFTDGGYVLQEFVESNVLVNLRDLSIEVDKYGSTFPPESPSESSSVPSELHSSSSESAASEALSTGFARE